MTDLNEPGPADPHALELEDGMARLLRLGGARAAVPPDREDRVRTAVFAEIRAVAQARTRRRWVLSGGAALAAAAVVLLALRVAPPPEPIVPSLATLASIDRIVGDGGRLVRAGVDARVVPLGPATEVRTGDQIETDRAGRVGLRLVSGVSVRLDQGTRARFVAPSVVELASGTIYVDSGSAAAGLEVRTAFGVVRDIGTQFEVRIESAAVRVRVRSGLVEVHRGDETTSARPGTEVTAGPAGVEHRDVDAFGPDWLWASALAPEFAIEGRSLGDFLEHVAREQGSTLVYAERQLALEASGIILHGSVEGLAPADALGVVMATTGFTSRIGDGQIVVVRGARP